MTAVFDESLLPLALVKERELDHNIESFASYCREHALELAPHVKTTMSREIFARQKAAGVWGATVATPAQAQRVLDWGVDRLFLAAQVVDPVGLAWLLGARRAGAEIYTWVDSISGLERIEAAHRAHSATDPVRLLVELGHDGGRSGCRQNEEALALARAVAASESAELHGIAAFEGTVAGGRAAAAIASVDEVIGRLAAAHAEMSRLDVLATPGPIITVGGSAYFDRVAANLGALSREKAQVILRSGCYVTHDCGVYDELSPLGSTGEDALQPALEVWGAVISVPEERLAIANIGRRDVSFDAGLPRVVRIRRNGGTVAEADTTLEVTALNDQHAFIADPEQSLQVGDLIGTCISHPCTTFDKWRELALVNPSYQRTGTIATEF
jgi:D-serine deaminase-like pyridoxal phosphate-dependent protein